MIKQTLYCVRDSKAEHFLPPFASQNDQTAIRQFADAVSSTGHEFQRNAPDFSLWTVGAFNLATGVIESTPPTPLIQATDIQNNHPTQPATPTLISDAG